MLAFLKQVFPHLSDQLLFRWQQLQFFRKNQAFLKKHSGTAFPDDYTLYESYQLNHQKYLADGAATAKEILDSVKTYLPPAPAILDWGCGPARITRHLKRCCPDAQVSGSDINAKTIAWNQTHIHDIDFVLQQQSPPLPFADEQFNLVIGFSVFTHIPADVQQDWLNELYRILQPGGILWITTHGNHFIHRLSSVQQQLIQQKGIHHTSYPKTGHRMMTVWHEPGYFKKILEARFKSIVHFDGATHPEQAGRQDLWILKK